MVGKLPNCSQARRSRTGITRDLWIRQSPPSQSRAMIQAPSLNAASERVMSENQILLADRKKYFCLTFPRHRRREEVFRSKSKDQPQSQTQALPPQGMSPVQSVTDVPVHSSLSRLGFSCISVKRRDCFGSCSSGGRCRGEQGPQHSMERRHPWTLADLSVLIVGECRPKPFAAVTNVDLTNSRLSTPSSPSY